MSREKPNDDPRERTDWESNRQTKEPWKGIPEKDQRPQGGDEKIDLEKWNDTGTH
jgi:hypothetical protein